MQITQLLNIYLRILTYFHYVKALYQSGLRVQGNSQN